MSHPNIIRLEEVIQTEELLILVLELAEGGELFYQMMKKTRLDDDVDDQLAQPARAFIRYENYKG